MTPRSFKRRRREQGSALLLAIFFLITLFLVALALFRLIPTELHSAGRSRQDLQAQYACGAGTKHAVAWLTAVLDTAVGSIGSVASCSPKNEPFGMDQADPNTAYRYAGAGATNHGEASFGAAGADFGNDFDTLAFSDKPCLYLTGGPLHISGPSGSPWAVSVWIFPDRQTYPIPEYRADLRGAFPSNSQSLRYYTIITEAAPFDDPTHPRMRTRVTIGQTNFAQYARFDDEWPDNVPYTAMRNKNTVDGPFHTNAFFRIRPEDANYFNPAFPWDGNAAHTSFKRLSFAGNSQSDLNPGDSYNPYNIVSQDGVAYKNGNYSNSGPLPNPIPDNNNYLPWDNTGADKAGSYEKLTGGRANLEKVSPIELPATTADLQKAAWGYGDPGTVPAGTGLFVRNDGGAVNGGIYVKGNTRETVLAVAGTDGSMNYGTAAITDPGNPMLMIEMSQRINNVPIVPPNTITTLSNSTTWIPTGTSLSYSTTYTPTASSRVVQTVVNPIIGSVGQTTSVVYSYSYSYSTYACGTVGGGGGFGSEVTIYCTNTATFTTGSNTITTTINGTIGYNTVTQTVWQTAYQTNTATVTNTQYSASVTTLTGTNVVSRTNFYPQERVVDLTASGQAMDIPLTYSGKVLAQGGVAMTTSLHVDPGNVLILRDSRTNAKQVEVEIIPGNLNGLVYSEDHLLGVHGVNKGKRTIAADVGVATQAGSAGKEIHVGMPTTRYRSGVATNQSSSPQRADIYQWGTSPGASPASGDNVLGLVGQKVGLDTRRQDLNTLYTSGNPLNIYAVILGGRGGDEDPANDPDNPAIADPRKGGFRIFNLTSASLMGNTPLNYGQYGYFKMFGGLIERRGAENWQVNGGGQKRGWDTSFTYDIWASRSSPPFFPTTNTFQAIAYGAQYLGATYQR